MKTEIIKQANVKFDEDDRELIKKVITLVTELVKAGDNYGSYYYVIDGITRDTDDFENLMDFLRDLAYADVIELT